MGRKKCEGMKEEEGGAGERRKGGWEGLASRQTVCGKKRDRAGRTAAAATVNGS